MGAIQSRLQLMGSQTPTTPSAQNESFTAIRRNDAPHFRFLDLPPEIRNMVYEEFVVVGKIFYTPDNYDIWNGLRCRDHKLFRKPELQLLRVCKQIHDEAESVYLSKNLFVLPIHWQKCHPFVDIDDSFVEVKTSWQTEPATVRHIFSSAGLAYVRNVSVAVDQKLTKMGAYTHEFWKYEKFVFGPTSFLQHTVQDRYERTHDAHLDVLYDHWDGMLHTLRVFKAGLLYVELDFTNAYCGIGDCRPINTSVTWWIRWVEPKAIDMLGLQSADEKQDFLSAAADCAITHGELRHKYGLRFRKLGDNKIWNKWRMEGELEDESKHYGQE